MFQKATLSLLLLVIISCKDKTATEKDQIKSANWLLGNWASKIDDGILLENWKQINDSTFQGESFFIKGKDTLHFESITLQQKGEELFYNATVKGQNENKAVPFRLTSKTEKQLVFENPKHDYPQKITYTQISKDSLVASISGVQLGKASAEKFGMKKAEPQK
ncbi:DUF6265 family protein [Flavobacterium aestuarii]|uniref:DUF6265 family protein n=1 Tax=Flavobacterium aestuarii TaxID=3149227 RepID=UPI0032B34846